MSQAGKDVLNTRKRCVYSEKNGRKSQINPLWLTGYRVYRINNGNVLRVCCKDNRTAFPQRTNASFRGKKKQYIWSNAVLSLWDKFTKKWKFSHYPLTLHVNGKSAEVSSSTKNFLQLHRETAMQRSAEKHKTAPYSSSDTVNVSGSPEKFIWKEKICSLCAHLRCATVFSCYVKHWSFKGAICKNWPTIEQEG